ncbi:MAG TPA: ATP-grasp domain-containing protein [Solirubrobacteraceae bacterium]|nr:ATP-grasp domain-containing protein [Solirubrobacteraceae bacterium]
MAPPGTATALVMGGFDVVRPLTLAGIECALFAAPHDPTRASRRIRAALPYADPRADPAGTVRVLLDYASAQPQRPVLYPANDAVILLASRERARLAEGFHLPLADAELIEDLLHKDRFAALAERARLPVPASRRLTVAEAPPSDLDVRFPVIVKPVTRGRPWQRRLTDAKALVAADAADLAARWPELAPGADVLVQEAIPGPETRIESYHVYVDGDGRVAGEFTGRKVRTYPRSFGESTAVEITDEADVRRLGREVVERLGLRGVAKLDFKRAPDGAPALLEINPRFNLWHHPGALAGVNLPALAHADATGAARAAPRPLRAGVRWCDPLLDPLAARADGLALRRWARWAVRCETYSGFAWDDPLPLVRRVFNRSLGPQVRRIARRIAER